MVQVGLGSRLGIGLGVRTRLGVGRLGWVWGLGWLWGLGWVWGLGSGWGLACLECKVAKQYLTHKQIEGSEKTQIAQKWSTASKFLAYKRKGESNMCTGHGPEPKKKRRLKTFSSLVMLNNMMKQTLNKTLLHFIIGVDDPRSPFTWPRLNLAPDQGSTMVCMDHWMACRKKLNNITDWDLCHGTQADVTHALSFYGI